MNSLTTEGIKISVKTRYEPSESRPDRDYFAFSYHISINNDSEQTVRLLDRHWFIKDANTENREVKGPGVVGQQPILKPGESHHYSSWCPLPTPIGKMSGYFTMQVQEDNRLFKAQVPEFKMMAEFLLN